LNCKYITFLDKTRKKDYDYNTGYDQMTKGHGTARHETRVTQSRSLASEKQINI